MQYFELHPIALLICEKWTHANAGSPARGGEATGGTSR
jgi:hypothetical protein